MGFSTHSNSVIAFRKVPFYNDEPKIYQYIAALRDSPQDGESIRGCGSDMLRQTAVRKAVGEAMERACLRGDKELPILQCATADISYPLVEPQKFQPYSANQLKTEPFRRMRFSETSIFRWTVGINALTDQEIWIPAQLVFCPYDFSAEPVIRFPSSNGAASGYSITEARCRAVLEVFERDAFMCWYLAAMPASFVSTEILGHNVDIVKIISMYERYKLDLQLLILPSRWSFPVVLALIIDRTGIGPGLQIGLKCHPHLPTAIKGAIAEAQQMRPWLRDHMQLYGLPQSLKKSDVIDSWSRALFWARPEQYQQISDLWTCGRIKKYEENVSYPPVKEEADWKAVWNLILSDIDRSGASLFLFDISGSMVKAFGVSVVKAVIPQAQPVYMDERYPYLRSENLILALDSFGPRWNLEKTDNTDFEFPPHPFS